LNPVENLLFRSHNRGIVNACCCIITGETIQKAKNSVKWTLLRKRENNLEYIQL
jgi:hypothetical protein